MKMFGIMVFSVFCYVLGFVLFFCIIVWFVFVYGGLVEVFWAEFILFDCELDDIVLVIVYLVVGLYVIIEGCNVG